MPTAPHMTPPIIPMQVLQPMPAPPPPRRSMSMFDRSRPIHPATDTPPQPQAVPFQPGQNMPDQVQQTPQPAKSWRMFRSRNPAPASHPSTPAQTPSHGSWFGRPRPSEPTQMPAPTAPPPPPSMFPRSASMDPVKTGTPRSFTRQSSRIIGPPQPTVNKNYTRHPMQSAYPQAIQYPFGAYPLMPHPYHFG